MTTIKDNTTSTGKKTGKPQKNSSLIRAKANKNDEFYTQISDIEKELRHYKEHFNGKKVFLNCDDPTTSNFWVYFSLNFDHLGLSELISTHYEEKGSSYMLRMTAADEEPVKIQLKENGDFRSEECLALLDEADVVVSNPPFSLMREYISTLVEHDKKFLVLSSYIAVSCKDLFPLVQQGVLWLGSNHGDMSFQVPDWYPPKKTRYWVDENGKKWRSMGNIVWLTNLDIPRRHHNLTLWKEYSKEEFPGFDEAPDVINVNKVSDIPEDWYGMMGVPITFLDRHNPDQFELIGLDRYVSFNPAPGKRFHIDGKEKYARVIIRRTSKAGTQKETGGDQHDCS